jgi:HlyD family secretion protein
MERRGTGRWLRLALLWTLGVASTLACDRAPEGLVFANGRIEGDPVTVAPKVSGRLIALHVEEGDALEAGDPIAELDADEVRARIEQAAAGIDAATGGVEAARAAAVAASREVVRAGAALDAARARQTKAAQDDRRAAKLLAEGVLPEASRDEALAARDVAEAEVRAASEQVEEARHAARAGQARVRAAESELVRNRATLDELRSRFGETQIQAPVRGVVMTKVAEEGEVLAAGAPIVVLVDLDRLYMKAYVSEPEIGRVRLGSEARVYVDAYPERPFGAVVREIASESEFTPKEVQTREERVKQVVAVKLFIDQNPDHVLVPGMPADAVIRWKREAPWVNPLGR